MSIQSFLTKSLAVAALSFAVIGGSGVGATPAEAGFKKHHHHGFRIVIGAPLVYGGYGYRYRHYGDGCRWLHRKAIHTGSPYWWKRFHQCRYGW
jgi:hypothetical protein